MHAIDRLARGREAFERSAWAEAYAELAGADAVSPLDPADLDRLADAAYLVGEDAASTAARARAHHGFLARGSPIQAARSAFWQAFAILDQPGQQAQAGGWLARARRLIDEHTEECAEQGFLLCALAFQQIGRGELPAARAAFAEAARLGTRFADPDLIALARHGEGRVRIRQRHTADGLAMLDEVMVSVTCGEVGPMVAGVVYCSVISACHELFDLRRATEWTKALAGWCATHPDMVPFRGQCLVRRSELLQLHGDWLQSLGEVQRACARIAEPAVRPEAGMAHYQLAELHRLRGEFTAAETSFRDASQAGRRPQPGLALLRLAQGHAEAAAAAIRQAMHETRAWPQRAHLLRAGVEILLAAGDPAAAQDAADELTRIAGERDAPFLRAAAAHAAGAVALAGGSSGAAVEPLREAWAIWRELEAPYEGARVRMLLGEAYARLGDLEAAQLELEAAQEAFERLGAAPDAECAARVLRPLAPRASGPLTGREVEVLRLVATGKTNRAIAADLSISEKTVARHISNIFNKLDLSSRAEATAYAYSHKVL